MYARINSNGFYLSFVSQNTMSTGGEGSQGPRPGVDPDTEQLWKQRMEQQMRETTEQMRDIFAVQARMLDMITAQAAAPRPQAPAPVPVVPVVPAGLEEVQESVGVSQGREEPAVLEDPEEKLYLKNRREFMKYDAPRFDGSLESGVAEAWIVDIEQRFTSARTADRFKVRLIPGVLVGAASKWWLALEREQRVPTTWSEFRRMFYEEFFPYVVRQQRRLEFMQLTQGTLSVREYQQRFTALSEFAPEIVALEENKISQFFHGLRADIRTLISSHENLTFARVFDGAMRVERSILLGLSETTPVSMTVAAQTQPGPTVVLPAAYQSYSTPAGSVTASGGQGISGRAKRRQDWVRKKAEKRKMGDNASSQPTIAPGTIYYSAPLPTGSQGSVVRPPAPVIVPAVLPPRPPIPQQSGGRGRGRGQPGSAQARFPAPYRPQPICYTCGQSGHVMKYCPMNTASSVGSAAPPTHQTHAVAEADPEATRRLLEGMLFICGKFMHTLIDPGSTLSFISGSLVDELGLRPTRLEQPLVLITVAKERFYPNLVCKQCSIKIGEHDLPNDLRVMEFLEYEALLGMDWLAKYRAVIDCFSKEVIFYIPNLPEIIVYRGYNPTRSATRGREATVSDLERATGLVTLGEPGQEEKISKMPVVCEFPDVFPTDLPGIPPHREVEFIIDLVPGTKPISIPPYRMAPQELKELKSQLEELEQKGFIHPSMSP